MSEVAVQLTNGFGNNIFQYVACSLLAEHHETSCYVIPPSQDYYAIKGLQDLGVRVEQKRLPQALNISDKTYKMAYDSRVKGQNLFLTGYFEDYTFYIDNLDKIKSWFGPLQKRNNRDLVVHMRTGDRLFMKNEFYLKPKVEDYLNAVSKFDFDKLHIVTDMPKWENITADQLSNTKFHVNIPASQRVPLSESVKYINDLIDGFKKHSPIVEKRDVAEDFKFIRTFDNILFEHGTLSWWAAVLSDASKVGVYGPWREWKGDKNKNLSQVPLDGWFKWEKQ